jgi:hypothetical protein
MSIGRARAESVAYNQTDPAGVALFPSASANWQIADFSQPVE